MTVHDTTGGKPVHMSGRAFSVFGITFSFVAMAVSGVMLFLAPKGRTANEIDWTLLGLGRGGWEGIHLAVSFLFTGLAVWHFLLHRKIYKPLYAGTPIHPGGHKREIRIAFALVAVLVVAAILNWPPSGWLMDINEFFKQEFWAPAGGAQPH